MECYKKTNKRTHTINTHSLTVRDSILVTL